MKKILFAAAVSALVLSSCSNDEVLSTRQDAMTYAVTTSNTSRAAALYSNSNSITSFTLYAVTDGKIFMNGDALSYTDGAWSNTTANRYWPSTEVTFYGVYGATLEGTFDATNTPKFNYEVKENSTEQVDFVYSTNKTTRPDDGKLTMNFRHALSQVVFKASSSYANLQVELTAVTLHNVYSKGQYTLPTDATDDNYVTKTNNYPTQQGEWSLEDANKADFGITFDSKVLGETAADLDECTNAMLMIPSTFTAAADINGEDTENAYITLTAKITNVAGETVSDDDIVLYDGEIYMPLGFSWEEGKKYVYTFKFVEGGDAGYDKDGKPVLCGITYDVTVDNFYTPDGVEKEMKTTPAAEENND